MKKIGTAKLLVERVYDNPYSPDYAVIVEPGIYDINETTEGRIYLDLRGFELRPVGLERILEEEVQGLFLLNPKDCAKSDVLVDIIPRFWSRQEFDDFRSDNICKEGSPYQRWVISLTSEDK
jgi:hypothetical protein